MVRVMVQCTIGACCLFLNVEFRVMAQVIVQCTIGAQGVIITGGAGPMWCFAVAAAAWWASLSRFDDGYESPWRQLETLHVDGLI